LAILWIAGAAILLSRLALGSLWFHFRLSRKRLARKPQLAEILARLRAEQNLRTNPDIIETPLVTSPCLFGLFKPRLLLPADLHSHLTQSELSHVILHELAHLKRGDLFTNLLISLAHSIHWFNPVVWFVSRRMRLERELACDQFVLQSRSATDARAYGQTLLKLLQDVTSNSSAPALVGIAEDKHTATVRVSQIAKFKPGPARFSRFGFALILLIAVCGLTNAQKNQADAKDSDAAATPDFAQNILSSAAPQKYGIEALEREYALQRKVVDEALNKLNKIRIDLGIVEVTNGTPADTTIKEIDAIQAAIAVTREKFATDTAMLDYLKKRERADIRKALPTMLRPPDEPLNRFLEDLGKTEQQIVSLAPNFSEEHPEVRRLREVAAKIEHQIEDRIDGILMGLEARKSVYENLLKNLKSEIDSKVEESSRRPEKYMPYFAAKRSLEDAQRILDTIFMRLLAEKVDSQSTK
jgi:beta-lactamase regulating signal transducer with metallopeptidase domain